MSPSPNRRSNGSVVFLYKESDERAFLRGFTGFQIACDLRFAIRITNRNRNEIARSGALSANLKATGLETWWPLFEIARYVVLAPLQSAVRIVMPLFSFVQVVRIMSYSAKVQCVSHR